MKEPLYYYIRGNRKTLGSWSTSCELGMEPLQAKLYPKYKKQFSKTVCYSITHPIHINKPIFTTYPNNHIHFWTMAAIWVHWCFPLLFDSNIALWNNYSLALTILHLRVIPSAIFAWKKSSNHALDVITNWIGEQETTHHISWDFLDNDPYQDFSSFFFSPFIMVFYWFMVLNFSFFMIKKCVLIFMFYTNIHSFTPSDTCKCII